MVVNTLAEESFDIATNGARVCENRSKNAICSTELKKTVCQHVGAIWGNLVFYVVPIVATLGGWALLGEAISALTIVGFVTIFLGFAIIGHDPITRELSRLRGILASRADAESETVASVLQSDTNWGDQD